MGHFYATITLRGPEHEQVLSALRQSGRIAYVSPTVDGSSVVYDDACDDQDTDLITALSAQLSATLRCPALAVLNHDDDLLWYALYDDGQLVDRYNSDPHLFNPALAAANPTGGDAARLCATYSCPHIEQLARVLHESHTADAYVFAVDRHMALVELLGLPQLSVGFGYEDIADDNLPEEVQNDLFEHT